MKNNYIICANPDFRTDGDMNFIIQIKMEMLFDKEYRFGKKINEYDGIRTKRGFYVFTDISNTYMVLKLNCGLDKGTYDDAELYDSLGETKIKCNKSPWKEFRESAIESAKECLQKRADELGRMFCF